MDSTTRIQAVPDWNWPRARHRELEVAATLIAEGVVEARAGIIDPRRGRTTLYSAGARIIARKRQELLGGAVGGPR